MQDVEILENRLKIIFEYLYYVKLGDERIFYFFFFF